MATIINGHSEWSANALIWQDRPGVDLERLALTHRGDGVPHCVDVVEQQARPAHAQVLLDTRPQPLPYSRRCQYPGFEERTMRVPPCLAAVVLAVPVLAAAPLASPAAAQTAYRSYSLNSAHGAPAGALIYFNGAFCGDTDQGRVNDLGIVFCVANGVETVLHTFTGPPDGDYPDGALLAVGDLLYGTTGEGGANNDGIVFSIDPVTDNETIFHSFASGSDGSEPFAALINFGGKLYGTTVYGGEGDAGTVFSVDPATGAYSVLYSFGLTKNDGRNPESALLAVGNLLYGTTTRGGVGGKQSAGAIFSLNPATGKETVEFSFGAPPIVGSFPVGALVAGNGVLYGATMFGGVPGEDGILFQFDPKTRVEKTIYGFGYGFGGVVNNGDTPYSGPIFSAGLLYGTTAYGGSNFCGVVYQINPATGISTTLHNFCDTSTDGSSPLDPLLFHDKLLYGSTDSGGSALAGTVFSLPR